jgi:hypothetical protein
VSYSQVAALILGMRFPHLWALTYHMHEVNVIMKLNMQIFQNKLDHEVRVDREFGF